MGADTGLDRPDQKARPCLLTRFAYHLAPTPAALKALVNAEASVAILLAGLAPNAPDFRVRLTHLADNGFAVELHLSAPVEDLLHAKLQRAVEDAGFTRPEILVPQCLSGFFDAAR